MSSLLSQRAMLTRLNVRQFSGRKLDRRVSREVNDAHAAAPDVARVSKRLLAKEALAAIQGIGNAARAAHYQMTSPWLDDGALYPEYTARMAAFRNDWEAEVAKFVAAYPDMREAAKSELGDLFQEDDYPSERDIEKRFELRVAVYNVPDASDFRVDVGEGQAEDIRRKIQGATDDALRGATRDAYERIKEVAERMAERLRAFKPGTDGVKASGVFHDTLVSNIRDLCAVLPGLNIAGDPDLAKMTARLTDELAGYDADTLRDDAGIRADTAAAAEAILAHVSDYLS